MQKDIQFTADVFPLGIGRYMQHVRGIDQFFTDAADGTLPAFSLVDPDFDAYSEENPQDIRKGESFAAEVINQVLHGTGWPDTLLIWVYDEHGGYYDHVPPPPAIPPDDVEGRSVVGERERLRRSCGRFPRPGEKQENLTEGPRRYDRYGFRVPAVIVSPYARPGYVCSEIFDHTSVLKLVEEKWNLPALTARDAAAMRHWTRWTSPALPPSWSPRPCPSPASNGVPGNRRLDSGTTRQPSDMFAASAGGSAIPAAGDQEEADENSALAPERGGPYRVRH